MASINEILYGQQSVGEPTKVDYSKQMSVGSPEESRQKLKKMQKEAVKKQLTSKLSIEAPKQETTPTPETGSTFTGDSKGLMATGAMAMSTMKAQDSTSAIIGGAMTGLSASTMISGAAAGPVGVAIGLGAAMSGMVNARKQKKAQERAEAERKKEIEKARELQLLQSKSQSRQQAIQTLMGAFK